MPRGTKLADTYISVGASLDEFRKGLAEARAEAERVSFGSALKTSFIGLGDVIKEYRGGFRSFGGSIKDAVAEVGHLGNAFRGGLNAAINGAKAAAQGLLGVFKDIGKGILQGVGIGAGFGLVEIIGQLVGAIPKLIDAGREYGQQVYDVMKTTGANAKAASEFVATLRLLHPEINNTVQLLGQFQRNMSTPLVAKQLRELGVATKDMTGANLDAITVLGNLREAVQKYGTTSQVVAVIQQTVGRGGLQAFLDFLQLTDMQVTQIIDRARSQGLILTEDQARLAVEAGRASRDMGNAWTGLGNVLFNTVGPSIIAFLSTLANAISANAQQIAQFIGDAINTILGFVNGLLGGDALGGFAAALGAFGNEARPAAARVQELNIQIAELEQSQGNAADQTKAATTAIDRQVRAVDRQISALAELERQQDRTYRKALAALNAQLDAQLKLLSAQDRALQNQRTDEQNKEALRRAQIDLASAQAQLQQDTASGATDKLDRDLVAVEQAAQRVREAQQQIADEAFNRSQQARRDQIQAVKDFIAELERLVSDAGTSTAAAKDDLAQLIAKEKELRKAGAGSAAPGSDQAIMLQAVLDAEKRVRQRQANDIKKLSLEALKQQLQEERAAITANARSITQIQLAELRKQREAAERAAKVEAEAIDFIKTHARQLGETISSPGDSIATKFTEATEAAKKFVKDVTPVLEGLKKLLEDILNVVGGVTTLFNFLAGVVKAMSPGLRLLLPDATGTSTSSPTPTQPKTSTTSTVGTAGQIVSGSSVYYIPGAKQTGGAGFAGGGQPSVGWNLVGERGPELIWSGGNDFVLNNQTSSALARLNSGYFGGPVAAGATDLSPAIIRIEIGGNRLFDHLDRNLAYRRR